jgi:hypothetical protein
MYLQRNRKEYFALWRDRKDEMKCYSINGLTFSSASDEDDILTYELAILENILGL